MRQTAEWIEKRALALSRTLRAKSKSLQQRLEEGTHKGESCWLWVGAKDTGGYGLICDRIGREGNVSTHRLAWELKNGPIPFGLCVLHRCDIRNCVNPAHLFLGTIADNNRDCVAKGRSAAQNNNPMWNSESRKKVSAALTGKRKSAAHIEKMRQANIGKVIPIETRTKISQTLTGRPRPSDIMERIAAKRRGKPGKPHTAEARLKMSIARRGQAGRPHSEEAKAKMRAAWERRKQRA